MLTAAPPAGPGLGPQAPHTPQDHPHFPPVLALAAPGPRLPVGRTILIIIPNMSWADTSVQNSKKKMAENLKLKVTDLQNMN